MSDSIEVQLVPMNADDRRDLAQGIQYLTHLGNLLGDDWEGWEAIKGLDRIRERIRIGYAQTFRIPLPTSMTPEREPLMTAQADE